MISRLLQNLDAGTGLLSAWRRSQERPIRLSLGDALLPCIAAIFLVMAVTGIAMAFHYAPTTTDAWPSVHRLVNEVPLGAFIRSVHEVGTSFLIVLLGLAVVHGVLTAGYRSPRGAAWLGLVALLGVLPLFPMTGNLLPWDETGFWQTQVEASVIGNMPVVGDIAARVLLGGAAITNLTLTRYYALHVFVAPLIFWLLLRLAWTRRTAPRDVDDGEAYGRRQFWLELAASALVLAVLGGLAAWLPAPLDAPADAARGVDARPEWYFMPLYALRKAFEGPAEVLGTAAIPGLLGAILAAMPLLDPKGTRRALFGGVLGLAVVALGALTAMAMKADHENAAYQQDLTKVAARGVLATGYAKRAGSHAAVDGTIPLYQGAMLFEREACSSCHVSALGSPEAPKGPDLRGFGSRAWVKRFLMNPSAPEHFGLTALKYDENTGVGMTPYASLGEPVLTELTEFLVSLSGTVKTDPVMVAAGKAHFEGGDCSGCHDLEGGESTGPHLRGYGSSAWLAAVIADPNHPAHYGAAATEMPDYPHLSSSELRLIATWIRDAMPDDISASTP